MPANVYSQNGSFGDVYKMSTLKGHRSGIPLLPLPVFRRRLACMGFEELVEDALVGEVQQIHDLLDGFVGIFEQVFGFQNYIGINPVRCAAAAGHFHQFGQVLGRQAQFIGIKSHAALLVVIFGDQGQEAFEYLVHAGR